MELFKHNMQLFLKGKTGEKHMHAVLLTHLFCLNLSLSSHHVEVTASRDKHVQTWWVTSCGANVTASWEFIQPVTLHSVLHQPSFKEQEQMFFNVSTKCTQADNEQCISQ